VAKKTNKMKISQEKAVRVFEYFGFKTAAKWTPERMTEKLITLIESLDPKTKFKSKKVKALCLELAAADKIVVSAKKKDADEDEKDTSKEGKDKKGKGKDKKKAPAKKRGITRLDASVKVLRSMKKKGLTVEEAVGEADALYVEKGGTANMNESAYSFKLAARVLEVADIVVFSEDRKTVKPA